MKEENVFQIGNMFSKNWKENWENKQVNGNDTRKVYGYISKIAEKTWKPTKANNVEKQVIN